MTTTDQADRLARLQNRRAAPDTVNTDTEAATDELSTTEVATGPNPPGPVAAPPSGPPRQRRCGSPARDAKIITVGVSTTAMFGMIAAYGIADGVVSADPVTTEAAEVPGTPQAPVASSVMTPSTVPVTTVPVTTLAPTMTTTTVLPQVVVVIIDSATGLPISTTIGNADGFLESAIAELTPSASQPTGASTTSTTSASQFPATPAPATPAPAVPAPAPAAPAPAPAAPAPVELAVPPAPAPAPAPAPPPEGSSGGS